jgi:butyryl-CoA dehydrogenase
VDILLNDEEKMFKQQMRDFADKEIKPYAAEWDRRDEFARESWDKLAKMGLMGLTIPTEYGGQGGTVVLYSIAVEELAQVCASTSLHLSTGLGLSLRTIYRNATEEQRQRFVAPAARGEKVCAFAITERGAGSDNTLMETTATRDGDGWVLNGAKCFITNGDVADIVIVFATIDRALKGRGITAFIVEKGTPGFSVGKIEDKMGIRGTSNAELYFDDCRLPGFNLIGEVGRGFPIALAGLDEGRIGIASQAVGIAQGALDQSIAYAKERQQFGQRIADFQAIQWMIADMATAIDAARLLAYRAARLADAGERFTREAAQAKVYASEVAVEATRKAIQIHGGYGYMRDLPLERFYRDAKITEIYEGTSEIQRWVIARALLA